MFSAQSVELTLKRPSDRLSLFPCYRLLRTETGSQHGGWITTDHVSGAIHLWTWRTSLIMYRPI